MHVTRVRLRRWSTQDAAGARHARMSWSSRGGLLLDLETDTGLVGRGEASPLPGYSPDTLEECEAALSSLAASAVRLPDEPRNVEASWIRLAGLVPHSLPAARCAVEMALADLCAQNAELPLWELLHTLPMSAGAPPPAHRSVAALLSAADPGALAEETAKRLGEGYRAVKLKTNGQHPLPFEAERWHAAGSVAHLGGVPLRLDANQTWQESELDRWLGAAAEQGAEFVEEPVPLHHPWRGGVSPTPTALDESLANLVTWPSPGELRQRNVQVIVLKPMLLGLARCLEAAAWARGLGLGVVISHTFEGPRGFALALALASAVGSPDRAHGLAPHAILEARFPEVVFDGVASGGLALSSRPGLGMESRRPEVPRE